MNNKKTSCSSGSPEPKKHSLRSKEHQSQKAAKPKKRQYRIRNWSDYNTALVQRGSLTLWLEKDVQQHWYNEDHTGKRGRRRIFSEQAIACILRLRDVFHLPLRATEGLLRSLVLLLGLDVMIPCYSTLSRRQKGLSVDLDAPVSAEPLHLVVDGTGLKVFGDGEWKVRQHGASKRRVWRKVHLAVDKDTGYIQAAATTASSVSDGQMLPSLLEQVEQSISQVSADGGYDSRGCYDAISKRGAKAVIPPRHGARIWQHGNSRQERLARDENLRRIRKVGMSKWKRESGYHWRSLVETAMFRLKTIFGGALRGRSDETQER